MPLFWAQHWIPRIPPTWTNELFQCKVIASGKKVHVDNTHIDTVLAVIMLSAAAAVVVVIVVAAAAAVVVEVGSYVLASNIKCQNYDTYSRSVFFFREMDIHDGNVSSCCSLALFLMSITRRK